MKAASAAPPATETGGRWIAAALIVTLPLRAGFPVANSLLSWGVVIAALLAPTILGSFTRSGRFATPLITTAALSVLSAPLLLLASGREIDGSLAVISTLAIPVAILIIASVVWARERLSLGTIAGLWGVGTALQVGLSQQGLDETGWKFYWAFPVTLVVLAVVGARRSILLLTLSLAGLWMASIAGGYRSHIGVTAVAFIAALAIRASQRWEAPRRRTFVALATIIGSVVVYFSAIALALTGFLGDRNQVVTSDQTGGGAAAIAQGRSESGATWALFQSQPWGFGPGVIPNSSDFRTGIGGLAGEGLTVNESYVQDYLLGDAIKLHSVAADLWAQFGLAGAALALVIVVCLLTSFSTRLTDDPASLSPVVLYLFVLALWDMAFSPIGSNLNEVALAIGILMTAPVPPPVDARVRANRTSRGRF